jgi:hypothetical protein
MGGAGELVSAPGGLEEMDQRTLAELGREYDEYVERARQYHAEHGVWPPDPLLDEVADMRRQIMAENGNDWRKVLQWHVEQDRLYGQRNGDSTTPAVPDESAAVSGR